MGRAGRLVAEEFPVRGERIAMSSVRLGPPRRQATRRAAPDVVEELADEVWIAAGTQAV